jgi:flavin-binding protein dodecin
MPDSIYKVIELIGTSDKSWEEAAKKAVEKAATTLEELRIAEVVDMDMKIEQGKVVAYRTKVKVSFRFKDK